METETRLAAGIRAADEESKYDAVCKELLSEKIILAHILKTCAVEFAEYDVSEIAEKFIEGTPVISAEPVMRNESASKISGMGEVDATITEGIVTYDIYFRAVLPKGEGVIELIVNVEAQGGYKVTYPLVKRGVYYSCRMVSAQYGREFSHSHYEKVKKVYSIWICMNPAQKRRNSISRYSMAEESVIGDTHEKREHYCGTRRMEVTSTLLGHYPFRPLPFRVKRCQRIGGEIRVLENIVAKANHAVNAVIPIGKVEERI